MACISMNIRKTYLCRFHSSCRSLSFFEKLGNPKYISAPMVAHSELAFRLLTKTNGVDLAFTEMMNSRNFTVSPKTQVDYIDWVNYEHNSKSEDIYKKTKALDRPLIAQFCGSNPTMLVSAAKVVQEDVSAVDLNLGCPQGIARKGNYGAYLMSNRPLVKELLTTMVNELSCPVTAKIRIFESKEDTISFAQMIESCGVSMLTVHGRTITQNKQYCGEANWDMIAAIKQSVSIPVIANGGIDSLSTAQKCLEHTGCNGVMSSECLLENPKMFSIQGDIDFMYDYAWTQLVTVREYLKLVESYRTGHDYVDSQKHRKQHLSTADNNSNKLKVNILRSDTRSHVFKLLYRYLNAPKNKDLQQQLGDSKVITTLPQLHELINKLENRVYKIHYSTEYAIAEGLVCENTWYKRYRRSKSNDVV